LVNFILVIIEFLQDWGLIRILLAEPRQRNPRLPTKIEETLSTLGCSGYESVKKEEQGIYEIDDAECKMGTVDIKLDNDYTVVLISRY